MLLVISEGVKTRARDSLELGYPSCTGYVSEAEIGFYVIIAAALDGTVSKPAMVRLFTIGLFLIGFAVAVDSLVESMLNI